jgi:hypothetical protein
MTFRFTSFISVGKASLGHSIGAGRDACGGKSYHNGGIEGDKFSKWYDAHLSDHFGKGSKLGDWLKGHDGKGSDGTGKGSDGTGKGSDGTGKHGGKWGHGKGADGTGKGSGKGSDGTGKGSDGTGKGSDGTGKWGKWGKWHDKWGHDGKGSDGTGKGSDGTGKGSDGTGKGSDGTGKGSDGTGKGSDGTGKWGHGSGKGTGKGSDGTGKGSDGTGKGGCGTGKGSDGTGKGEEPQDPGDGKTTHTYEMGHPGEITISVTQDLQGQLFVSLNQSDWDGEPADIDGIFFNLADDSTLGSLNFFPDENTTGREVTDIQTDADGVTGLPNGAEAGGNFDVGLQFGLTPDSANGTVTGTNFTLWSDDGPLSISDIDFSGMRVIVNSENGNGEVLGVSASDDPNFDASHAAPDSEVTFDDVMGLMTQEVPEDEDEMPDEEEDLLMDA